MLLQAASPLGIPILVLDPSPIAPAKQVLAPHLLPLSSAKPHAPLPPLSHIDGPFTSESKIRQLAQSVDIITIEIEHVDVDALKRVEKDFKSTGGRRGEGIKVWPSSDVIQVIQDKYRQKVFMVKKGVRVADFKKVELEEGFVAKEGEDERDGLKKSLELAGEEFGYPLMVKSRHLAYDGKGNFVMKSPSDISSALEALIPTSSLPSSSQSSSNIKPLSERLYTERWAPFTKECAVMVVRNPSGQIVSYPAVETIHRDSVCHIVYAPLRPPRGDTMGVGKEQRGQGNHVGGDLGERARRLAESAVEALGEGAVGVFGVEMFLMQDGKSEQP